MISASRKALPLETDTTQKRAAPESLQVLVQESAVGWILGAHSQEGMCGVFLGDDPQSVNEELNQFFPDVSIVEGDRAFRHLMSRLTRYTVSPETLADITLDMRGTLFQQKVWRALCHIPQGSTASYTDIAHQIAQPKAIRAVASACAANPLAILVPCHRVIRQDGTLSGYRGGIERKRHLLTIEGVL